MATLLATADVEGRFTLDIHRSGRGGTSNSRQSGAFTLAAGRPAQLSASAINIQPADRLEIELKLFTGGEEVFAVTAKSRAPAEEDRRL